MKIYIGTDHRGIETEKNIIDYLKNKKYEVIECRIEHSDADDYVDFAKDVSLNVVNNENAMGILICGTGIGMSIAANKIKGIRAVCKNFTRTTSSTIFNLSKLGIHTCPQNRK